MDRLRRQRDAIRSAATRVIAAATEALQETEPTYTDLQVLLNELDDKDHGLAEINARIEELVIDDDEYEAEFTESLEYHEMIHHAISRVCFRLHSRSLPTAASPFPEPQAVHSVCATGKQANVSANARPPTSCIQQPRLPTEGRVQRQLILNNEKASAYTSPQITTRTDDKFDLPENETMPKTETGKPLSLDKVDQIRNSEPNRHRSCSSHDRHRSVDTDHHRQSSARNRSPEASICTASTTRSYVTAPKSSTRGLTFIDRPRYFPPTTSQSPPHMPDDYKLDNIQKRRNVCNSTGTVVTYRIPPRRYTSGRHRGTYIKNKTDVDNLLCMCRSKKTMKETPLTAPLVICAPSREVWPSVPTWWDASSNRRRQRDRVLTRELLREWQ